MGLIFSRENARIEEIDPTSNNAYKYPPVKGNYFANSYIMAGERFETTQPEAYLFGDNMDLNFLGKPTPFPYPAPQPNEPTRTLRSLMNIRKESLRFVKAPESERDKMLSENTAPSSTAYNIEFYFDTDVRCAITLYYFCTEDINSNCVTYTPKYSSMNSETYHYKKGVNQQFSQVSHVFDPSKYSEDSLSYKFTDEVIPVLIQCVAEEAEEPRQSHAVIAAVEQNSDGTYTLKALKQKIFIDGLCYLMQEIYGIENKNVQESRDVSDEDDVDCGLECVICMSDARDTLILPCRHLCLCNSCGDSLRYAANNCPICRCPFRALLQIRAVRKSNNALSQVNHNAENQPSQDIPPGYEPVSLIEALNGPTQNITAFPAFGSTQVPPFTNSPDVRQKHRHLERHHSSSTSLRHSENVNPEKENTSSEKVQNTLEGSSVPEVVSSLMSSERAIDKTESLSLTRGEGKRHRKGFRTSSAPEKMRLLANSVQIVNEVGSAKRKTEKDAELAETKSLLESNITSEDLSATTSSSPKTSRPCSRNSPISLSTPHSLHLCEKSSKDMSPGGDDSDYYTPEDPSTTILVDQGTDTSLDTPQGIEATHISELVGKNRNEYPLVGKHKINRERHVAIEEVPVSDGGLLLHDKTKISSDPLKRTETSLSHLKSPNCHSVINLETPSSLPGTPASNVSNHSSGDSFSSTSSTRLLLRPQIYDTLPE